MNLLIIIIFFLSMTFAVDTEIVIDASDFDDWKYFSFTSGELIEVDIQEPELSLSWDLGVMRNHFKTNSGLSGIGSGGSTVDSTETFTSVNWSDLYSSSDLMFIEDGILENLIYDIETHTMSSQPGSLVLETWGWFDYDNNYQFNVNNFKYFIRTADGTKLLKFWVKDYYNDLGQSAHITLQYTDQIGCFEDECGICSGLGPIQYYNCNGNCITDMDGDSVCDELELEGCQDVIACNYNPSSTEEDGSCIYQQENYDCNGICLVDFDCNGICGGILVFDNCGVCGGDDSTCTDCNGDINGDAFIDGCSSCVAGNTDMAPCSIDCNGIDGGTAWINECDKCVENGDFSCVQGCDGNWFDDGSELSEDSCGICGGDDMSCTGCIDELACNYDINATIDSECIYPEDNYNCDGQLLYFENLGISKFHLYPAFPNPFNPITNIKYSLVEYSRVIIQIYDFNGTIMKEILNKKMSPGVYVEYWDASNYASGIYLLNLTTDRDSKFQKLILVK